MAISGRFVVQSTAALFAVGLAALLAIIATAIWLGERSQRSLGEVNAAREIRSIAVDIRSAAQAAESSQRGYILTSNEIYLAPYDRSKALALRQVDALKRAFAHPSNGALLTRLTAAVADKVDEMDRSIALKKSRQDEQAIAILRTNRGKLLMDEIELFASGIVRVSEERLVTASAEQSANAKLLRTVSVLAGMVIVLVVGGAIITIHRYTRAIRQARDEVQLSNLTLEQRVSDRTTDLAAARDRAEALLAEVNHRVANSLSLVAALVRLQSRAAQDPAAKDALDETQARIEAISLVHKRLYASGDIGLVALDEYLSGLLEQLEASLRNAGRSAVLRYELEPLKLKIDASVNLGVVVAEWVTNAFKYAYSDHPGEVRVKLKARPDGQGELVVEDDGVGRDEDVSPKGTGFGSRIVMAMARSMEAKVDYIRRQPGTAAKIVFPLSRVIAAPV